MEAPTIPYVAEHYIWRRARTEAISLHPTLDLAVEVCRPVPERDWLLLSSHGDPDVLDVITTAIACVSHHGFDLSGALLADTLERATAARLTVFAELCAAAAYLALSCGHNQAARGYAVDSLNAAPSARSARSAHGVLRLVVCAITLDKDDEQVLGQAARDVLTYRAG